VIRGVLVSAAAQAVRLALAPERGAFVRALGAPRAAQDGALRRIVDGLVATDYGRAHRLRSGDGYAAFRDKLPVVGYDDLAPWVERQMREEGSILVPGPVRVYEKTSGSSGPTKHVPYTAALCRAFDRMFRLWLADLLAAGPRLSTGRTWISVSPRLEAPETTPHGVPVGLPSDLDYLEGAGGWLLRPFLVLPAALARVRDPEAFKRILAAHLVAGRPEVVSVWSPSFLAVLLDWITGHRDTVLADWRAGAIRVEGDVFPLGRPTAAAIRGLEREPIDWRAVLPDLRLISCWADGPAAPAAAHLRHRLPWVRFQAKGLLATEAPVTVPLAGPGICMPLVHEVFVELADAAGAIHRIDEAEPGVEYSIIVSPPGGFARYRLGDRVRAGAPVGATPSLAFIGREDEICDLVGEKLAEPFVRSALDALPLGAPGFLALVPLREPDGRGRYVLVVDRMPLARDEVVSRLDALLQRAHRYREARQLGQLAPPDLAVRAAAADRLLDALVARGMRRGAIKPSCLVRDPTLGRELLA
jgi:hypothetical protein